MHVFRSTLDAARVLNPDAPVTCFRPHAADRAGRWFAAKFPGKVLYAVKTNPDPLIIDSLYGAGIRTFDVASIAEIQLVKNRHPEARLAYMHPVKSRQSIERAYFEFGVRVFALDTQEELDKIVAATGNAKDLSLLVRVSVSNHHAELDLSKKFGAHFMDAIPLLLSTRQKADRLGVCFHVGSQCMNPAAFALAMEHAQRLATQAGVILDIMDVGGGFPAPYPDLEPPPLSDYMDVITQTFGNLSLGEGCELWCEPGRALSAEASSTLVRVTLRKGNTLYINDGAYGSLFDAGHLNFIFPMKAFRTEGDMATELAQFSLYGPTCDDMDHMKGPFYLPSDIGEGDFIEVGMTGAYGATMRTMFNGFYSEVGTIVRDEPMFSMYAETDEKESAAGNHA
ncbi:MAG: type III PLP-dependent enzyme [Rhodospirillales bacterium]|nr:type III PLP-dependent enzyme [Rhodospirillales bacterium]